MAKKYVILDIVKGEYLQDVIYGNWTFVNKQLAQSMIGWITINCPELYNNYEVVEIDVKIGE